MRKSPTQCWQTSKRARMFPTAHEFESPAPSATAQRSHAFRKLRKHCACRRGADRSRFFLFARPRASAVLNSAALVLISAATSSRSRAASTPRPAIARKLGAAAFGFSPSPIARHEEPRFAPLSPQSGFRRRSDREENYGDEFTRGRTI